jgi:chaperonin cofactor prefoldin
MKKNKVRVLKEYGSQLDERIQALHQELQDSIVDNKRL